MTDVKQGVTSSDEDIAVMLRKSNKPVILVCNKVDNIPSTSSNGSLSPGRAVYTSKYLSTDIPFDTTLISSGSFALFSARTTSSIFSPLTYKLKCFNFLNKEMKQLDNGESNIEDEN